MKGALDELIASGEIQPTIAIMPDAPWSGRASYYVDSAYTGADPGRKVETAFTHDLIAHVDSAYRTVAARTGAESAGYSMGGYGALRYSLAHPDLFGAALVLSPAVYVPDPPVDSSPREYGAFGLGKSHFIDSIYRKLNYPALFPAFAASGHECRCSSPSATTSTRTRTRRTHRTTSTSRPTSSSTTVRVPNMTAELRVVDGGHDWDVWGPTFVEGAKYIFQFLNQAPMTPMNARLTGTAGGARGRCRRRRRRQRLPGDRRRRLRRRADLRRRQGPRARQGLAGGRAALDASSSARPGSSGPTASRSTGPATWSSPATRPATSTARTPATPPTTSSSPSSTRPGTGVWLTQFGVAGVADRGYARRRGRGRERLRDGLHARQPRRRRTSGDKDVFLTKFGPTGQSSG